MDCEAHSGEEGTLIVSGRTLPPSRSTPRTTSAPYRWPAAGAGSAQAPSCHCYILHELFYII